MKTYQIKHADSRFGQIESFTKSFSGDGEAISFLHRFVKCAKSPEAWARTTINGEQDFYFHRHGHLVCVDLFFARPDNHL
jgi:hypothetical protein